MNRAADMLSALFQSAPNDAFINLRMISPRDQRVVEEFVPADKVARAAEWAIARASAGDVYVGVLPRSRQAGGRDAIPHGQCVWVDCDSSEAVAALEKFELRPSMVVASGSASNVHAYWLLTEAVQVDRIEEINRRLQHEFGSDTVYDAPRILRVPGTLNHKHDLPTDVVLMDCNRAQHTVEEIEGALPEVDLGAGGPLTTKDGAAIGGTDTPVEWLLDRLDAVRETRTGWMARCPAHEDDTPSLSVGEAENGRCLVKCFAGCKAEEVVRAVGLKLADLFPDGPEGHGNRGLSAVLVDIGHDAGVVLFHDAGGTAYARVPVGDHHEVWTVTSRRFKRWLRFELRRQLGRMAKADAVNEAVEYLSSEGDFDGPEQEVYLRSAWAPDGFVYNLADEEGRVARVTSDGWTIQTDIDIAFLRRSSVIGLAVPDPGGSIELLRRYVNVESDEDFALILAWLVMGLRPSGPYPVLILQGEQGSAKSTLSRLLKELLDPVKAPLRSVPSTLRDLAIAAESNAVMAADNLSVLSPANSDAICRLSTGGGFSTRALYTDDEERIFDQMRAVILNGIDAIATRQDLLDRAIVLRLPPIAGDKRIDEAMFWQEFERDRPKILGALLDAAATALGEWETTAVSGFRMADFARWAAASMPAFGSTPEAFIAAYRDNRSGALKASLEGSPLSKLVQRLLMDREQVEEEPAVVYEKLRSLLDEGERKANSFPKSPQAMSRQLTLLAQALREIGIEVTTTTRGSGGRKRRWIVISRVPERDAGTHGTRPAAQERVDTGD